MPITWRSLADTLNPQPVAFTVIRKLLKWIGRCDHASQQNSPPPPFCAEDGSPIFPPEGDEFELWWLTEFELWCLFEREGGSHESIATGREL